MGAPRAATQQRAPAARIAFVGFRGHQGSAYLRAVSLLRGVTVVGLVDVELEGAWPAWSADAPVFASCSTMIAAAAPDVAVVTVPHDQHYPIIAELVASGAHVLVEKPLVPDWDSARRLLDLSISSGRSILTLTQRPLRPEFSYLRKVLPRIGDPHWAEWRYSLALTAPTGGWRSVRESARGGVMLDMGYHALDALVLLFGRARVSGAQKSYRYETSKLEDLEDLMSASLRFPEVSMDCHILVARHARQKSETLEVHGSRGFIEVDVRSPRVTLYDTGGTMLDRFVGPVKAMDSLALVLSHFLELADDPRAAAMHLRHHVGLVELCEEMYRASRSEGGAAGAVPASLALEQEGS